MCDWKVERWIIQLFCNLLSITSGGKNYLTSNNISRRVILYDLLFSGASRAKLLGVWINVKVTVFPSENILKDLKSQFLE